MIKIDTRSTSPLFEQIFYQVRKMIILGIYQEEDQLPTVRQLSRDLGINPNTVAKAYAMCEEFKLVYSKPGLGFFVLTSSNAKSHAINEYKDNFHHLIKELKELNFTDSEITALIKGENHD